MHIEYGGNYHATNLASAAVHVCEVATRLLGMEGEEREQIKARSHGQVEGGLEVVIRCEDKPQSLFDDSPSIHIGTNLIQ